jgi:hypothetical protein
MNRVNSELPALLREMIVKSGLNYHDLGERLGLSTTILSLIVQGKRYPARDTIIVLGYECGYDRCELDYVLRIAGYSVLMGDGPASLPIPQEGTSTNRYRPGNMLEVPSKVQAEYD